MEKPAVSSAMAPASVCAGASNSVHGVTPVPVNRKSAVAEHVSAVYSCSVRGL